MFSQLLSLKQKKVFISMAEQVLIVDNEFTIEEELYFTKLCNEMNIMPSDKMDYTTSDLKILFNTEKSKKILLVELLNLAYADGFFHQKEEDLLTNILAPLSISVSDYAHAKGLVEDVSKLEVKLTEFIQS